MFRFFKVNDIQERRKILVAQSDVHRQTFLAQMAAMQESTARYRRLLTIAGLSTAAVGLGARIAKSFFSKRREPGKSGGVISKVISGISYFNQAKSLFKRFQGNGDHGDEQD